MAKKKPSANGAALDVRVSFGGVSIGDGTARIGIGIGRSRLSIDRADEFFSGKRLTGRIEVHDSQEDQGHLEGFDGLVAAMEGVFDVKSFNASAKHLGTGLTFNLPSIDAGQLCKFAKREGKLIVASLEELPEGAGEE